jgi:hypothetical protein
MNPKITLDAMGYLAAIVTNDLKTADAILNDADARAVAEFLAFWIRYDALVPPKLGGREHLLDRIGAMTELATEDELET